MRPNSPGKNAVVAFFPLAKFAAKLLGELFRADLNGLLFAKFFQLLVQFRARIAQDADR